MNRHDRRKQAAADALIGDIVAQLDAVDISDFLGGDDGAAVFTAIVKHLTPQEAKAALWEAAADSRARALALERLAAQFGEE
jgi:hypothetical protein